MITLELNKKLKCGVWCAYYAMKYWGDEELAEIFLIESNMVNCPSTFDFPRWALPAEKAAALNRINPK